MRRNDYVCTKCDHFHEQVLRMHDDPSPCPKCGARVEWVPSVPFVKPAPDMFWENENGGRGRYISQLQRAPGQGECDANAYCRSQNEAIDKAKRLGFKVERRR